VLRVELPVKALEPVKQRDISGPGSLTAFGSLCRWRVSLHRKPQELAFGQSAQRPRHPRIEEPDDGL
jgi:hypothetical protein